MTPNDACTIHTDGGARGNPGPAAFAFTLERDGAPVVEDKGYIGETTNNIAEYTAVVRALEKARDLGVRRVRLLSDSELMVQQMNGAYKVKNPGLLPLYEKAQGLCEHFDAVEFSHIRREHNSRADRLCNEALDAALGKKAAPARRSAKAETSGGDPRHRVEEDAVECLRASAQAWSRGNAQNPRPEDVWDQLWSILEEGGVLKHPRRK